MSPTTECILSMFVTTEHYWCTKHLLCMSGTTEHLLSMSGTTECWLSMTGITERLLTMSGTTELILSMSVTTECLLSISVSTECLLSMSGTTEHLLRSLWGHLPMCEGHLPDPWDMLLLFSCLGSKIIEYRLCHLPWIKVIFHRFCFHVEAQNLFIFWSSMAKGNLPWLWGHLPMCEVLNVDPWAMPSNFFINAIIGRSVDRVTCIKILKRIPNWKLCYIFQVGMLDFSSGFF